MNKTKIEWTDYTWNPIKGLCPVNCKLPDGTEYCYARSIYKRFGKYYKPTFWPHLVAEPKGLKKPSKIFVCSTFELFHPSVDGGYRDEIFETIKNCPQHTFQILTKLPQNIDGLMPDNVWLGVSITGNTLEDFNRASFFGFKPRKARVQFLSYEPILEEPVRNVPNVDWIIVGRLTGHGHKHDPKREWIEKTISSDETLNTPIFLKDNLKEIWGDPLIQEFPKIADE